MNKTKIDFNKYCPTCKWLAFKGQIMEITDCPRATGPCSDCRVFSEQQGTNRPLNYVYWSDNENARS